MSKQPVLPDNWQSIVTVEQVNEEAARQGVDPEQLAALLDAAAGGLPGLA